MSPDVRNAIETVMLEDIEKIRKMPMDDGNRREAVGSVVRMAEVVNTSDQLDEKWVDNSERRELEERKAKEANEVELKKSKLTVGKVALEIAKVGIPLAVGVPLYLKVWKGNLFFEEHGYLKSQTARDLKLPKIFKF